MKTTITDGGKPLNLQHETMDCTVRAIAVAGRIPYHIAHRLMTNAGRKPCSHKGAHMHCGLRLYQLDGFGTYSDVHLVNRIDPWSPGLPTMAQFIREHSRGRYIIKTTGYSIRCRHVLSIINGIPHDDAPARLRKRILSAWRIEPKS